MANRAYKRQDHLYHQAKEQGYRSRAAFKLLELQSKFKLINRRARVLDLGAAPGGWIQASLKCLGPEGVVIGIDLEKIEPIVDERAGFVHGDITDEDALERTQQMLAEKLKDVGFLDENENLPLMFDVILSDMSPKLTGIKEVDAHRSAHLCEMAMTTARQLLKPNGNFVAKLFKNQESAKFFKQCRKSFKNLKRLELEATRRSSNEFYMVGKGLLK